MSFLCHYIQGKSYKKGFITFDAVKRIIDEGVSNNLYGVKFNIRGEPPKLRIQTVMLPEIISAFEQYKSFWSKIADEVGFLDYKEMKVKKKGIEYPWACPQIWQRMAVWWDGTILPCNHDDDGMLAFGNIHEVSIKDLWRSSFLNDIRNKHRNGMSHTVPACDGCYLRDSEIIKLMEKDKRT